MRCRQLVEPFPTTTLDEDALDAARRMAAERRPGLVVVDDAGKVLRVLPGSQVLRFVVPRYVQDDPALARVIDEQAGDKVSAKLRGRMVRDVLPADGRDEIPVVRDDDTVLEIAAVMAAAHSPLVVVTDASKRLVGVVTVSKLLTVLTGTAE